MFRRYSTVALVSALVGALLSAPATAATPVRIMPLGASITWGTASTDGNGYREELREHLVNDAGITIDYVGSQKSGNAADGDHEGHPGYRIDEIAAGAPAWLSTYHPDVVLINVGTNDMIQDHDLPTAPARLRGLSDQIITALPAVTVVFSTLVPSPNATTNATVQAFNAELPAIARVEVSYTHAVAEGWQ